jgi:enamine deaminase RidA (YjgF/YER057c/UK114 family)
MSHATMPAAIRPDHFPYFPYEGFTFCLGLQRGDDAWLSGHSGATWDQSLGKMAVGGSMAEQAATMYDKIGTILAAAGLGFCDVVQLTENVSAAGLDSYPEAEEIRRTVLGGREPALSTVIVDRLVRRAALIEVQVTARRGGGTAVSQSEQTRWRRSVLTEADGLVHLPTLLPVGPDGELIAPGDFGAQYRCCLERADGLLGAVGLSLANVVRTVSYAPMTTRDAYLQAIEARRELLGPVYPADARILMSRLPVPGALLALDVTASRHPHEVVAAGPGHDETVLASRGVEAGGLLFMSGVTATDAQTGKPVHPGDLAAQAAHIYSAILDLVRLTGGSAEQLIETIEYVTPEGVPDYRAVAGVRERLLRPPWPASVGAVCAGLVPQESLLAVIPTAVIPS